MNSSYKTIFISLSVSTVIDNLTVPDGVLDRLIADKPKNVRFVLLAFKNAFKEKLARYESDNVLIEDLKKYEPRGIIQKIFHFFYSYLIFTGTTRILATFGARADIPPAGGNRHLAFLKSFVANTFGKLKFIKKRIVPWLFVKLIRARPYAYLFEKYNPDLIFLPNIAFFSDVELLSEAKRREVKTIGMAYNWDHLNKYFIPLQADSFLVQNEPMRREAVELQGYDEENVFVVGFPQFDMLFNYKKYLVPREDFFKKFNVPLDGKIIVFISGAAYSVDEPDIIRAISKWIKNDKFKQKNLRIMIRPYVIARDKAREEEKFREFKSDPCATFNSLRRDEGLENKKYYISMLYYADMIISIFSTMAIEAAIFDKPILTIGFDGYKKRPKHQSITRLEDLSHFRHILDTGSVVVTRNFDDLYNNLRTYLDYPEKDREKRKLLAEKMCYKLDGMASKRIADFILEKANEE